MAYCLVKGCKHFAVVNYSVGRHFVQACDNHADEAKDISRTANDTIRNITREAFDRIRNLKVEKEYINRGS